MSCPLCMDCPCKAPRPEVDAYKWTALSERMPERYHHVIVAFQMYPGYKLMVCQDTVAWDGHRWCVGSSDVRYQGDVTHWMPLPEAPRSPLAATKPLRCSSIDPHDWPCKHCGAYIPEDCMKERQ